MEHNHCKCEHKNLKYCPHCDIVYCENCEKEWKKETSYSYYGGNTWTTDPKTGVQYKY